MKKYLIAGIAASLLGSVAINQSAYAADLAVPEMSEFDWTGFYLGGHIGYGEADFKGELDPDGTAEFDLSDLNVAGWAAGAQLGYNHQINALVLGIEGDVTVTNWHDELNDDDDSEEVEAHVDLLASVRGRLGWAFDRSLVYVTGGVAWADAEFRASGGSNGEFEEFDFNDLGGVVGGGFEYAVADNVSLRAEGLYYMFDDKKDLDDLSFTSEPGDHVEFDDAFVIRVGLNWLIN